MGKPEIERREYGRTETILADTTDPKPLGCALGTFCNMKQREDMCRTKKCILFNGKEENSSSEFEDSGSDGDTGIRGKKFRTQTPQT